MIKILAIGNSFSQDATAYLHDIAECGSIETKIVNLYIGGAPLSLHWENAAGNLRSYQYEINGITTDRMVSINETLLEEDWDIVTMQQASYDSGVEETYFPYIIRLSEYIKKYSSNAKQLIHQTWAYEIDSTHAGFDKYGNNQQIMYNSILSAYKKASQITGLGLIPCGETIQALRNNKEFDYKNGGRSLCRDGFHLDLIYGRYAAAATWYQSILCGNIPNNGYLPPCIEKGSNDPLIELIKKTVAAVCKCTKAHIGTGGQVRNC